MNSEADCRFDVRQVAIEEMIDYETLVVGLSEDEVGEGQSLLFQVALSAYDEQDRELGQDTYCISNEAGATTYGGVTSCGLDGNILTIRFEPQAADILSTEEECRLRLLVAPETITQLVEGLRRVFAREPVK